MRILLFMLIPLVFFAGGVFFSSLIWGKYKRRSEALRERLDKHESREKSLQEELEGERSAHTQLQTDCQTLKEEFAHTRAEREQLKIRVEQSAVERQHFEKIESDYAALAENLRAQRKRFEALLQEIEDLRQHSETHRERAIAAENRANQLDQEKGHILGLVNKLQERLNVLGQKADQLVEEKHERQVWQKKARIERLHKRRAIRNTTDPSPRNTRRPIPRTRFEQPERTQRTAISTPTPASSVNGQKPTPSMTRRVLSMAERLFSGTRGSAPRDRAANGVSTATHDSPPQSTQATPRKRRLRW